MVRKSENFARHGTRHTSKGEEGTVLVTARSQVPFLEAAATFPASSGLAGERGGVHSTPPPQEHPSEISVLIPSWSPQHRAVIGQGHITPPALLLAPSHRPPPT